MGPGDCVNTPKELGSEFVCHCFWCLVFNKHPPELVSRIRAETLNSGWSLGAKDRAGWRSLAECGGRGFDSALAGTLFPRGRLP